MKKTQFSSFGFATILLCFVMICIITFSTLSVVTSNSDYKLSKKVAQRNTLYYEKQQQAYDDLAQIDADCLAIYDTVSDETEFFNELNKTYSLSDTQELTLNYDVSQTQHLKIVITLSYPKNNSEYFYSVSSWRLITDPIEVEDSNLNLLGNESCE